VAKLFGVLALDRFNKFFGFSTAHSSSSLIMAFAGGKISYSDR